MAGWFARAVGRLEARFPRLQRVLGPWHRHRWLRWLTGTGVALASLAFVAFNWLWFSVELPDEPPHPQAALILSADGQELAAVAPDGLRFEIELDEVAPIAVKAVLAAEDRRFYEHSGLDPIGVGRAIWKNLRGGRQGGSTITQQLVKVDYLSRERSLWRKTREAILAVKLERSADKDEILERYLNVGYLGRNAYGIEAAARACFGTTAARLTLEQAALLAGLIRSPEGADPAESPDVAEQRRQLVLTALVRDEVIDDTEAETASAAPIEAVPEERGEID